MRTLILIDALQPDLTRELSAVAHQMTPGDLELHGMAFDPMLTLTACTLDVLHTPTRPIPAYDQAAIISACLSLIHTTAFEAILVPATPFGRQIAPRLAMALHTGLVADVTQIQRTEQGLIMIRPAYSGKLMASIVNTGNGPLMMSVRQSVFNGDHLPLKTPRIHRITQPVTLSTGLRPLETRPKTLTEDIRQANVLVSGGGGIQHHFKELHRLAEVLNAQVAASRRIVDSGIVSRKIQVGQSGKTVSPDLYVALGISGSVQHIEGLRNIKHLVVVNTNPNAPLTALADLVVVGDAVEFIHRFTERIRQRDAEGATHGR
jgi:electron transfer flavoprotein alpha subunit